ncbi:MAG: chemotaxis-specific protein-glutamate methyltransferase CheB [Bacteriovoracaceae bacterium]
MRQINSGELYFTDKSEEMRAILGSCIAFCVYDTKLKLAGMVHYLLPESKTDKTSLKYGDNAIASLLKMFKINGSAKEDLEVKIFGACFESIERNPMAKQVSQENLDIALKFIKKLNLNLVVKKVNSANGLQICFNSSDGSVRVKSENQKTKPVTDLVNRKIRVLIVDDSLPIRKIVNKILISDSRFEVVGEAKDCLEAEKLRLSLKPDVMTLDINMPGENGVSYLKRIQSIKGNCGILMLSDLSDREGDLVFKSIQYGAFDFMRKPSFENILEMGEEFKSKLIAASEFCRKTEFQKVPATNIKLKVSPSLIIIGSSTGGTEVIRKLIENMPEKTPPIIIIQHMPKNFTKVWASTLNAYSKLPIKEISHFDLLENNKIYIAPGDKQIKLKEINSELRFEVNDDPPVNLFRPSIDYFFNSIANLSLINKSRACILTGMGSDGAKGLLNLKEAGAETIAQDEASSVVFGMPKAAIKLKAVDHILSEEQLCKFLLR